MNNVLVKKMILIEEVLIFFMMKKEHQYYQNMFSIICFSRIISYNLTDHFFYHF
jgi:hypothetical protein